MHSILLNLYPSPPQYLPVTAKLCFDKSVCIKLEVARTLEEKTLGLKKRQSLQRNYGMLFEFAKPSSSGFWMLETYSPLDMIFLRENKVIYLAQNLPVCKGLPCPIYGQGILFDGVVELAAGEIKRLDIKEGDNIKIYRIKANY